MTNKPKNAKGAAGFSISGSRATGLYFSEAQGLKVVPKFSFLPLFDRTTMAAVPDGDPLAQPVGRYPIYRFSNGACDLFNSFLDISEYGLSDLGAWNLLSKRIGVKN